MPSFNQIISPDRQFIIAVKVFRPTQREFDYNESIQSADDYHALVDTGANGCGISERIVTDLNLQSHSQIEMMTAGTPHMTFAYLVGVAVAVTETEMRPEKQQDGNTVLKPFPISETAIGFPQIQVTSFPDVGAERGFDMILGMDILERFHITMYHGNIVISI